MTEKEVRFRGPGSMAVVETAAMMPASGQVRVRVERCGICGSDLHAFAGHGLIPAQCPGHEMSGVVDALGAGVQRVSEGDRVTVEPLSRCGTCRWCLAGDYHLCAALEVLGLGPPGGMATHVLVPEYTVHPLPDALDFALGALTEPTAVAVHAARLGGVRAGSRVLVLGGGTIGLLAAAAARRLDAAFVAVSARHQHQRALAESLGVDQVVDPQDLASLAQSPDVVLETVGGVATTVADAVYAVRRGGTIVIVGLFESAPAFDPLVMLVKETRLIGSMVYNRPAGGRADFDVALELLAAQPETMRRLITHEFALDDVQRAFETAADKRSGAVKVMLAPEP